MLRNYRARGWGRAKTPSAKRGNLAIGVAFGSGYQAIFAAMTSPQQQSVITQMKGAGISWVRIDAEWWTVQPTSGSFDWTVPDATADVLRAAGMNVVILLNQSPVWARRNAGVGLGTPWKTPDPALYAAFCAAAATHYAAKGIHTFELWNEPNLDVGATTSAGWGPWSPLGAAELAVAAYPAIKAADPKAVVLSPSLATSSQFGTIGTDRTNASWSDVTAGATTATITCTGAVTADAYGILTNTVDGWPVGSIITASTAGTGWTVRPPAWMTSFPAIPAGSGKTVRVSGPQYPPDVFLTQMYAAAAGQPMWDALAIHPYTQPVLPAAQLAIYGGWAMVPTLRQIMVSHGEGAKPMWLTEVGAPTGAGTASWSSAASSATSLTVTCTTAATADVGYQIVHGSLPTGCYISAVSAGTSWTVRPPTGITLSTALTSGTAVTSLTVAATPAALTIPSGTTLTVTVPLTSTASVKTFTVTTSASATTSTSGTTTISVTSATPGFSYPVGSLVRGTVGQTFGTSISAATSTAVTVLPPGVAAAFGMVTEAVQAQIIGQVFQSIVRGVPAGTGVIGSAPWPFAGPVFLYCWGDGGGGAGPFGLTRVDGTVKPALAAVATAYTTGGA
ncbi:cellulase family glycosylhydrolase [Streptomyces eurythermus]